MKLPARIQRQKGRHALVDGIPFALPVNSDRTPVLMAAFLVNPARAAQLLPGDELHPVRLFGRGLLLGSVVNYRSRTSAATSSTASPRESLRGQSRRQTLFLSSFETATGSASTSTTCR